MKNLYVLDPNNNMKYVIDYAESIIFNFKINDVGDCEIYIPYIDSKLTDKISLNDIIVDNLDDFSNSFIVKEIEIESDFSKGNYVLIKGETFETLLKQRYMEYLEVLEGNIEENVDHIISYVNNNFPLNKTIVTYLNIPDTTIHDFQFNLTSIFDCIKSMCAINNYNFIFLNGRYGSYELDIFEPISNNEVVFSPNNNNLVSFKKRLSNYDVINYALVHYEVPTDPEFQPDFSTDAIFYVGTNSTGNDSFHGVVDATDIKDNDAQLFKRLCDNKGLSEIAQNKPVKNIEIEVDASMFKFMRDYYIGNVVKVIDFFGNEYNAKIYEVTEKWDNNGYVCEPKLEIINNV